MAKSKRRKKNKKKVLKRNLFLFFLIVIIIGISLCFTVFFKITDITSEGSAVYSQEEIQTACSDIYGKNILLINSEAVLSSVCEKLPYAESIKLKKNLNGTLHIIVSDAEESYYFLANGGYYSASKDNKVLNKYSEEPEGLILVTANFENDITLGRELIFTDETQKETLSTVSDLLNGAGISINSADVTDSGNIVFGVEGRFKVNFGTLSYISEKVNHLKGMISSIDSERAGNINLTVYTSEKKQAFFTETHKE